MYKSFTYDIGTNILMLKCFDISALLPEIPGLSPSFAGDQTRKRATVKMKMIGFAAYAIQLVSSLLLEVIENRC